MALEGRLYFCGKSPGHLLQLIAVPNLLSSSWVQKPDKKWKEVLVTKSLPDSPNLNHLKDEAREIVNAHSREDASCCEVLRSLRRFEGKSDRDILSAELKLAEVQCALALAYGFESWAALKTQVVSLQQSQSVTPATYRAPAGNPYDSADPPMGLDEAQYDLVMSACSSGSQITRLEPFVAGWSRYPVSILIKQPTGREYWLLLQMTEHRHACEAEQTVIPILRKAGLPVPELLSSPVTHGDSGGTMLLTTRPRGKQLSFVDVSAKELDRTCELILEAVHLYEGATERILVDALAGEVLTTRTLQSDLESLVSGEGAWLSDARFRDAVAQLQSTVDGIDTPLVFTNGNVNSWHCLTEDGRLSGLINLSASCIEDPLIGFAKFRLWEQDRGWVPFKRAGIIERYLYSRNMTQSDFAPRLALCCLLELQRGGIPVSGEPSEYREWVLEVLDRSLSGMRPMAA